MIGDPNKNDTKGYISSTGNFQTFTFSYKPILWDLPGTGKTVLPQYFIYYFRISFEFSFFDFFCQKTRR